MGQTRAGWSGHHAAAGAIITCFIAKGNVKDAAKIFSSWSPRHYAGPGRTGHCATSARQEPAPQPAGHSGSHAEREEDHHRLQPSILERTESGTGTGALR